MTRDRAQAKHALSFILITIAIDSIGFGLIIPVLPSLLKELLGATAAEAAPWAGLLTLIYAASNFLVAPLLGNLSDRFGRRPILLASLLTLGCDYLLMGFAHTFWLLVVGRTLSGMSGATQSTAKAYIADITEPSKRARAFGLLGASFGTGFILGPVIGGFLGDISSRAPFFAAAGLAFANALYGFLILPESLSNENRRRFELSRANPLHLFARIAKLPSVRWLLLAMLFFNLAQVVYASTWTFHGDARYHWGSREIGFSLMAVGLGIMIVQGALLGPIVRRLGPGKTARFGLVCSLSAYIGFAFASEPWMIYAWIVVSSLGAVGGPSVNALMSARVDANAQGELQGAVSSVQALSNMVGPIVMTQTFSYFSAREFYGAAFLLAALLTLFSLIPLGIGLRAKNLPNPSLES